MRTITDDFGPMADEAVVECQPHHGFGHDRAGQSSVGKAQATDLGLPG